MDGNYYLVNYCIEQDYEFRVALKILPPLHSACKHGHKDIIELILKNQDRLKLNLNALDGIVSELTQTAFHHICSHGDEDLLKLFLKLTENNKTIDFNTKNLVEQSALFMYVTNPSVVSLLLKYHDQINLDLNTKDRFGRTPLQWACIEGCWESVKILMIVRKTV